MIQQHYDYTGSTVAKFVLDDFENQLQNFVKVFPRDYKKVLQKNGKETRRLERASSNSRF